VTFLIYFSESKSKIKNIRSSYESPRKRNKKNGITTTITLEENYSQSKQYQKGTLHSNGQQSNNKDSLRPTPCKSISSDSCMDLNQKSNEKAQKVYENDQNPLMKSGKPTSVKLEQ
jgi:hypothetical protein